jgi:MoaA/NifB/PqqE/SkfB family radical SAM enzyme
MTTIVEESCRFRPPTQGRLLLWELTGFCNLACKHCCTGSGPDVPTHDDLGTEEALAALEEFGAAEVRELVLTGGEPLARRDFVDLLTAAARVPQLDVYVATNATLLRDQHVEAFAEAAIRGTTISLDGHDARSHDAIRGAGAFARTIKGVRRCVEAGIPVRLSHMITPANVTAVPLFCRLAVELGVRTVALHTVIPAGTARNATDLVLLSPMAASIETGIAAAVSEFSDDLRIQHGMGGTDNPRHCAAGQQTLHISPTGDVTPCSWMYKLDRRFALGNLGRQSLLSCLDRISQTVGDYLGEPGCPIPQLADQARQRAEVSVPKPAAPAQP